MALLPTMFDASVVNPEIGIGVLPVGNLPVVISASEIKPTKDGMNKLLELELTVIDGPHKGESGAYRLNLFHHSDRTRELAQKDFSRLCHAVGVMQVKDTAQLHNLSFGVEVVLQKGSDTMTEVKRILTINGEDPAKANYAGPQAGSSGFTTPSAPVQPASPVQESQPTPEPASVQASQPASWSAGATPAPSAAGWTPNADAAPAAASGALPWGQ